MTDLVIASQLPADVNAKLAARLPHARIVPIAPGTPEGVPADATVLFAAPMRLKGRHVSETRPDGWPWKLQWVQLFSSGIDSYPDWLFDLPVATGRGSSAPAITEFVLAAIFAAAKQLPRIWLSDASQFDFAKRPKLASVRGSTIGIVGFGAIGSELARRAIGLGADVLALRRSSAPFEVAGVRRARGGGHLRRPGRRLGQPLGDGAAYDIEDRREQQSKSGHPDHTEEHRHPQRLAHLRSGAGGERQRHDAEDKGERGHQDRP